MRYSPLLALLGVAVGPSTAQSTTVVSLYLQPENVTTTRPFVGSVISVDSTATVYAVGCDPKANPNQCTILGNGSATVKQGLSTFEAHLSATGVLTTAANATVSATQKVDENCALTASAAVCTNVASLVLVSGTSTSTSSSSTVVTSTNYSSVLAPVTITAGLEKLSPSGSGGGGAPPASTTKPSAGGPRVTQQAVLAGAAAVVGAAMML